MYQLLPFNCDFLILLEPSIYLLLRMKNNEPVTISYSSIAQKIQPIISILCAFDQKWKNCFLFFAPLLEVFLNPLFIRHSKRELKIIQFYQIINNMLLKNNFTCILEIHYLRSTLQKPFPLYLNSVFFVFISIVFNQYFQSILLNSTILIAGDKSTCVLTRKLSLEQEPPGLADSLKLRQFQTLQLESCESDPAKITKSI